MAQKRTHTPTEEAQENIIHVFFHGFFWPIKIVIKALAWISHHPPLKQLGHGLQWFFHLRIVRFIAKILGFNYFRGSVQELKQVTWPSWRESRRLTTAVILFSIVFGAVIAIVDFGLDKLFKQILLK